MNNQSENIDTPIRVGKCVKKGWNYTTPQYPGYIAVRIHSMEREYGELSPYRLCDSRGRTIENLWQFSKVYFSVERSIQHKGFNKSQIIWDWPAEVHYGTDETKLKEIPDQQTLDINRLNYNFWKWRRTGFNCSYAIRYPNTYSGRHKPICAIWPAEGLAVEDKYFEYDENLRARNFEVIDTESKKLIFDANDYKTETKSMKFDSLDYVAARKRIYCGLYAELVKTQPKFVALRRELDKGNKLIISEVDGPRYENRYPYNLVTNESIPFTYDICKHLINDVTHPFGHGYTIAALLMGWDDLITDVNHVTLGGKLTSYTLKPAV